MADMHTADKVAPPAAAPWLLPAVAPAALAAAGCCSSLWRSFRSLSFAALLKTWYP